GSCRPAPRCGSAPSTAYRRLSIARSTSLPWHPCRHRSCRSGRRKWCLPSGTFLPRIKPSPVLRSSDAQVAVGQADTLRGPSLGAPLIECPAADGQVRADLGNGELVAWSPGCANGHVKFSLRRAACRPVGLVPPVAAVWCRSSCDGGSAQ